MRIGLEENYLNHAQFRHHARFRAARRRSVPAVRVEPTIHEVSLELRATLQCKNFRYRFSEALGSAAARVVLLRPISHARALRGRE